MKACPQCKQQFSEADDFCPHHGVKLLALSAVAGGGIAQPFVPVPIVGMQHGPDAADRMIGVTLDGRYQLTDLLGEGGMGVVYRARHTVIEKMVAVKILKREVSRDQSVVKRFLQEAKAASRIGHANIVDVTDFGTLPDGTPYAVMEFIDGVTLSKALRAATRMTAARALPIIMQMCRALAAAHEKGIVHRDLKPENIFLIERDGRKDIVKIVDFGIAKVAPLEGMDGGGARLTRAGSVFGTPEYMAPEQAAGRADNDHRVDIYAVAVILYEMLTGRVPHKGESLVATLAMQMLDPIVPPRQVNPQADISDELEEAIMKALAKDREQRFKSMLDMLATLEQIYEGIPIDPLVGGVSSRAYATGRQRSATEPPPTLRERRETPYPGRPLTGTPTARPSDSQTVIEAASASQPSIATPITSPTGRTVLDRTSSPTAVAARKRSRRLVVAAGGVTLVAAATLAIALITRKGDGSSGESRPLVAATVDAGVVARVAPVDAAAAAPSPIDATVVATVAQRDAGRVGTNVRTPTPGDPRPIPEGPPLDIVVRTKPAGGELYVNGDPAGSDGTTFHRPQGTKFDVKCTLKGYKPGRATVSFDGKVTDVTCTMKKEPRCRPDLHNPFDPCPR